MHRDRSIMALVVLFLLKTTLAQTVYQPCPLLQAYYTAPNLDKNSSAIQSFAQEFNSIFDSLIQSGGSEDFGAITPNTTSFSVVLFSGNEAAGEDPIIFEYHHTAALLDAAENVTTQTVFPVGTLTQLFTVFSWLVLTTDVSWSSPITDFLPELKETSLNTSEYDIDVGVNWESITVGSLASHMSGLVRDCKFHSRPLLCDDDPVD